MRHADAAADGLGAADASNHASDGAQKRRRLDRARPTVAAATAGQVCDIIDLVSSDDGDEDELAGCINRNRGGSNKQPLHTADDNSKDGQRSAASLQALASPSRSGAATAAAAAAAATAAREVVAVKVEEQQQLLGPAAGVAAGSSQQPVPATAQQAAVADMTDAAGQQAAVAGNADAAEVHDQSRKRQLTASDNEQQQPPAKKGKVSPPLEIAEAAQHVQQLESELTQLLGVEQQPQGPSSAGQGSSEVLGADMHHTSNAAGALDAAAADTPMSDAAAADVFMSDADAAFAAVADDDAVDGADAAGDAEGDDDTAAAAAAATANALEEQAMQLSDQIDTHILVLSGRAQSEQQKQLLDAVETKRKRWTEQLDAAADASNGVVNDVDLTNMEACLAGLQALSNVVGALAECAEAPSCLLLMDLLTHHVPVLPWLQSAAAAAVAAGRPEAAAAAAADRSVLSLLLRCWQQEQQESANAAGASRRQVTVAAAGDPQAVAAGTSMCKSVLTALLQQCRAVSNAAAVAAAASFAVQLLQGLELLLLVQWPSRCENLRKTKAGLLQWRLVRYCAGEVRLQAVLQDVDELFKRCKKAGV
jgi:hypothetical protein